MAYEILQKAVIYCRVSSAKQVNDGHGLSSQETRCREYTRHKKYEVVRTFHDEGLSGKLLERPQLREMLTYLAKHKKDNPVVIIDDISRLARDIETHIRLRTAISAVNGKLEAPRLNLARIQIVVWLSICWPLLRRISVKRMRSRLKTVCERGQ